MQTHVSWAHDTADLLHRIQVRAQTTMHCEDLLINNCCNGQAVEAVCESLPKFDVVSPFALIVETINTVYRGTFVVTTQDKEVFGIFDLVGEEQANGLERLLASVYVVT